MKKKLSLVMIGVVLIAAIMACSSSPLVVPTATAYPTYTPVPTYTSVPTQTPLPTYTPIPTNTPIPTETPVPTKASVPGIDDYLLVDGVKFKVTGLDFADEYPYMGETYYPSAESDVFVIVYIELVGELATLQGWMTEGETGLYIKDNFEQKDYWAIYDVAYGVGEIVFVVDSSVDSLTLVFPGGEEIDITPFLTK